MLIGVLKLRNTYISVIILKRKLLKHFLGGLNIHLTDFITNFRKETKKMNDFSRIINRYFVLDEWFCASN